MTTVDGATKAFTLADLQPGSQSLSGYLAVGEQLADVIAADNATLARLGTTHEALADFLDGLYKRAIESGGYFPGIVMVGELHVSVLRSFGFQHCPFCEGGRACDDVTVIRGDEVALRFSAQAPHLIRQHRFFESPNVRYRVDPQAVHSLMQLAQNTGK